MSRTFLLALAAVLAAAPFAYAHEPAGTPDPACEWGLGPHDYGAPAARVVGPAVDGAAARHCNEWFAPTGDDHDEFAAGGAWILAYGGHAVPSGDANVPSGSWYCLGRGADHSAYGPFRVEDASGVAGVRFRVSVDAHDALGNGDGCGDLQDDRFADCVDACAVTFAPGLDGAYRVSVAGAAGHVHAG